MVWFWKVSRGLLCRFNKFFDKLLNDLSLNRKKIANFARLFNLY